jgi:hypothetical protein
MGFRDMEIFNQAMLGRQCWRLLTDPTSLCARILKGRYFPNGNFWDAQCPRSASYTWRSILHGRKLLVLGARWGIGNGSTVRVTRDNWIPGTPPTMLKTLVQLNDGQTVDTLLDANLHSWDESVVRSIFSEEVARKVLQIPISCRGDNDFISWPHSRFGTYTVRSAYHLARSEEALVSRSKSGRGMSSDTLADTTLWKSLWAVHAPGKMRITLWRFAHNCLPTGQQLQRRHVPATSACIHCSMEESVEHALLFCPFAWDVWK